MKKIKAKASSALMIILASITIFFACKKINSNSGNDTTTPINIVTSSVAARVTDLNNVPISNASVTAGSIATTTDINGQFTIKNAQMEDMAKVFYCLQGRC